MPVDLSMPAAQVDLAGSACQPLPERLQENIVESHGRDEPRHVFRPCSLRSEAGTAA